MDVGFFSMNTDFGVRVDVMARALEERGFSSLWVGEHSHIPVSRATAYPAGGDLPKGYWHMLDPFVSLGMAAAVTTKLRLGTGVCLVLERDLVALAKEVATLDLLSDGRFDFGVGVGWNKEELATHTSIPFPQRYRALREAVAALRACWTQDESRFEGEFFNFDTLWSYPKPVQTPHPPVIFGAAGKLGMVHTAQWADGWCPIEVAFRDLSVGIDRMHAKLAEVDRQPADLPITMFAWGEPDEAKLARFQELGVAQVLFGTGTNTTGEHKATLDMLDRLAPAVASVR
ncbi:MAG: LLM class F420-dependent oxidoreductase [Acidimicrobiales bacterium]